MPDWTPLPKRQFRKQHRQWKAYFKTLDWWMENHPEGYTIQDSKDNQDWQRGYFDERFVESRERERALRELKYMRAPEPPDWRPTETIPEDYYAH